MITFYVILLLFTLISQVPSQNVEVISDGSQTGYPAAFYRRNSMTQDKETIGSLGGAPVGLYHRNQFPYRRIGFDPRTRILRPRPYFNQFGDMFPVIRTNLNSSLNLNISKSQNNGKAKKSHNSDLVIKIPKIIKNLLKSSDKRNLKQQLTSFGLGIGLGTVLGSMLQEQLS